MNFYLKTRHGKKHTNLPADVRQREDTAVDLLHVPGTGRGQAIASMIQTKKARVMEGIGRRITWWKGSNKRKKQQSPGHFKNSAIKNMRNVIIKKRKYMGEMAASLSG